MSTGDLPPEFSAIVEGFLRLTAEGKWLYKGEPIEHAGLLRILNTNFHKADDGRYLVHLHLPKGVQKVHVEIEDAPYFIQSVDLGRDAPRVLLTDETYESFDPAAVTIGEAGQTYFRVKNGERARFSRQAELELGEFLDEKNGRLGVTLAGGWQPLGPS